MEPKKTIRVYENQSVSTPKRPSVGSNSVEIHVKGGTISTTGAGGFSYGTPKSTVAYGTPKGVYPYTAPTAISQVPTPSCENKTMVTLTGKSEFHGSAWGLIGLTILIYFVTICTLGLGTAWAICKEKRWVADHTTIDGLQVVFDGCAGEIFWSLLWWSILSILTFGLYAFWAAIKLQKWATENTHLEAY